MKKPQMTPNEADLKGLIEKLRIMLKEGSPKIRLGLEAAIDLVWEVFNGKSASNAKAARSYRDRRRNRKPDA